MDDKELWQKISKLSPEHLKVVDTYVDYLFETKVKKQTPKPDEDKSNESRDKELNK